MWYFTWILGVLLACACGIINVLWFEFHSGGFGDNPSETKKITK